MKYVDIHHPIFKPISDLSKDECENLILAKAKNFKKVEKNGDCIEDYSSYFDKWEELVRYVALNRDWIYKQGEFNGLSFGDVTLRLLALSLKKR